MKKIIIVICLSLWLLTSCHYFNFKVDSSPVDVSTVKPEELELKKQELRAHYHFRKQKTYPQTTRYWISHQRYQDLKPSQAAIVIDLHLQRGFLMKWDKKVNRYIIVIDYAICSGRKGFETPVGTYSILKMNEHDKISNLYGNIYDAEGELINNDASFEDEIPEGGRFEGASMKYWMRLTWNGLGIHKGRVYRHPSSHGCIRCQEKVVKQVFAKVRVGTPVTIINSKPEVDNNMENSLLKQENS